MFPNIMGAYRVLSATQGASGACAVPDAGLKAVTRNRIDIGVSCIGQYGERFADSGIRGRLRLKFRTAPRGPGQQAVPNWAVM
ncbi:hypothetical protein [Komagataeibacter sp. FNDCF1]|uniref:hypothetical protein n=1 Tax=Komagataeibacter sp. FNDCF1 TaxID=2878681 RepID=UPI001E4E7D8F|nr:hypothetical protein [Komagataeibacter sp. FNDCF1]MCE2565197.1 hypothetical protein [Komagataeibacter sp. FNDCF1]